MPNKTLVIGGVHTPIDIDSTIELLEQDKKKIRTLAIEASKREFALIEEMAKAKLPSSKELPAELLFGIVRAAYGKLKKKDIMHNAFSIAHGYDLYLWAKKNGIQIIPIGLNTHEHPELDTALKKRGIKKGIPQKLNAIKEKFFLTRAKITRPDAIVIGAAHAVFLSKRLGGKLIFTKLGRYANQKFKSAARKDAVGRRWYQQRERRKHAYLKRKGFR